MIIIINKGLNKKGAKKMNELIELRKKNLKSKKYRAILLLAGSDIDERKCKPVKVGDKIGAPTKTLKRGWESFTNQTTMGTHLYHSVLLDYINYEVIEC
jgi:hypothetical protein